MFYKFSLDMHTRHNIDKKRLEKIIDCDFDFEIFDKYNNPPLTVVTFMHPKRFAYGDFLFNEYEPWYMDKLEKYAKALRDIGFDDIILFFEVFCIEDINHDFPQCNFEILNKELLKVIAKFDVAIPISIYCVKKEIAMDYLNLSEKEIDCML